MQLSPYIVGSNSMSTSIHIYMNVNCQRLRNYAELRLYTHKQNEVLVRSSLFIKGLSFAGWQHLLVLGFNSTNRVVSASSPSDSALHTGSRSVVF